MNEFDFSLDLTEHPIYDLKEFGSQLEVLFEAPAEALSPEQSTEIVNFLKNQPKQGYVPAKYSKTRWDEIHPYDTVLYFDLSRDRCSSLRRDSSRVLKIQPSKWPSLKEMELFLRTHGTDLIRILFEDNSILMTFDIERGCLDLFDRP